ncbi:40315_t:CDS:2, partial [Gigaspora margarita]
SNNSNNTPEDCKEIVEGIQNIRFEDAVVINKDNLGRNLELSQQVKLIKTRQCSKCSAIFKLTTSPSSIHSHLQNQHKLLLNKEILDSIVKKYSSETQTEKTQTILKWIILTLKPFKVVEEKAFHNMVQKLDPFYQILIALTADFWTSLKIKSFIAITIYLIDNNWKLQHFNLNSTKKITTFYQKLKYTSQQTQTIDDE